VSELDLSVASLEPDGEERFQRLRRQLGAGGRPPAEVPPPEDLLERDGR
jgi:hypothetical protein